jgi:hypothetical protein
LLVARKQQKGPSRLVLGLRFGVKGALQSPSKGSFCDLCEDSVAQRGQEVGLLRPIKVNRVCALSDHARPQFDRNQ